MTNTAINTNALFGFKELAWDYSSSDPRELSKTVATTKITLPSWMEEQKHDCLITISECRWSSLPLVYTAHIWIFNRGVGLVNESDKVLTLAECAYLCQDRLFDFASIFLQKQ